MKQTTECFTCGGGTGQAHPCICSTPKMQAFKQQHDELLASVDTLFDAIKHGDADHQAWLKDAIGKHFAIAKEVGKRDGQTTRQANNKSWRDPAEG